AAGVVAARAAVPAGRVPAPGARPARLPVAVGGAVRGAGAGDVRRGAAVAGAGPQRVRAAGSGAVRGDVRPGRRLAPARPRKRHRPGDVRLLHLQQRQHRLPHLRLGAAGGSGHGVRAGVQRRGVRSRCRAPAGGWPRRSVLALRGRAFGAGAGRDRDRRRGRPAAGAGAARAGPAAAGRCAGRGRTGRRAAVPGDPGDAGVRRVRGGVLVFDRIDPGAGEVRRRRPAVAAGAGLAGAGWAQRGSVPRRPRGGVADSRRPAPGAAAHGRGPGMRLDAARVELRPRSPWEAMELGLALVRRHACAIWWPWALVTLPLFALLNAAAWAIDAMWLAALATWWLLPLFDRIVLVVLSRAALGPAPRACQVLVAQRRLGTGRSPAPLAWTRLRTR